MHHKTQTTYKIENSNIYNMAPHMKGLHQFILDLRNASDLAEERRRINAEIHNIRQKYTGSSLDSYLKKKYLCKLLYIHLLGMHEDVRFGLDHAYDLLEALLFLEKQLGYLAVSVLFANDTTATSTSSNAEKSTPGGSDFLRRLVDETHVYLVRDLSAHLEDTNILALQFIASKFNVVCTQQANYDIYSAPDSAKWTQILELVYGLCVSPIAVPTVKMRALVALLVMAKSVPLTFQENDAWFPRLLSLLDERDLGIVTCSIPLATLLISFKPRLARALVPQLAALLSLLLVDENCPRTYFYYDVPAPWLVGRLLQLVEHIFTLPPGPWAVDLVSLDTETLSRLRKAVSKAINNASRPVQGQSDRNARSAILFQAVAIAPFLDASPEAIHGAIHALAQLLATPETNTRYLVLDALIKLSVRARQTAVFKEYLPTIQTLLEDRDVSVRRKTLDLLFSVCDEHSYTQITGIFLDFFPRAESALKTDILVKIAVLAERFATDSIWYVSTMLRLLSLGGQSSKPVSGADGKLRAGEVWERIVQIIVNNVDLQKMAAKYVINTLRKPDFEPPETILKVAAFILGEFGHQLVESEDPHGNFGLQNQFRILLSAYLASSIYTRPLVMNAFLKFVMRYPNEDFVPDILDLFDAESASLDLEIQTRAYEYLKLAMLFTSGNAEDIAFARSLVQPLPPFESKENKLISQLGSLKMISGGSASTVNVSKTANHQVTEHQRLGSPVSIGSEEESAAADPFGDSSINKTPQLSPNWYDGYHRMLQFDVGIFYEDQLVKLTYRITRDGHTLKIAFTIINNAAKTAEASISAFTIHDIHTFGNANYLIRMTKVPDLKIPQKSTMEFEVKVRDIIGNHDGPILAISYKCSGSFNTLTLKIPVVLAKTLAGTSMSSIDEFKRRWLQIGDFLGLEKGEKRGLVTAAHRRNSSTLAKMLQRLGLAIIQSTPDDPHSNILVMGAGILRMVTSNCGVLVTVKSIAPDSNDFDVIVRSTGVGVPAIVHDTIRELLDLKY